MERNENMNVSEEVLVFFFPTKIASLLTNNKLFTLPKYTWIYEFSLNFSH